MTITLKEYIINNQHKSNKELQKELGVSGVMLREYRKRFNCRKPPGRPRLENTIIIIEENNENIMENNYENIMENIPENIYDVGQSNERSNEENNGQRIEESENAIFLRKMRELNNSVTKRTGN